MPKKTSKARKIYVLDTSVILYDHHALKNFQDNDVAVPITVLEEVDNFKKGNDVINFEAREFIRMVDKLSGENLLQEWIPIHENREGRFKVIMDFRPKKNDSEKVFGEAKADHRILNAAIVLQEENPGSKVVLVSKDINLRLKAKGMSIQAEDYETGKIKDDDLNYSGKSLLENIDKNIIKEIYDTGYCALKDVKIKNPIANHYYILKNEEGNNSVLAFYNPFTKNMERVVKENAYGIKPRNAEQTFALHAILNPNVKLVTIQGVAGTGKTLLALAGALEQKKDYRQIYLARPIVPLSNKDIGFLPGDIKSKINPYMEPLWDNLKFIQSQFGEASKENHKINDMVQTEKLHITPLAYIRGRSLSNIFFIVDEAQNLTPHEVKTIITRLGENTKIVFTGDVFQIDSPYLDTHSNGLSHLINRMKGQELYAHITLEKGERSDLANLGNLLL
jgi:PhoH-like ATPase